MTLSEYLKKFDRSNQTKDCSFRNKFHNWQCPNSAIPKDEFCILHSKNNKKGKKDFLKELQKLIESQEKNSSNDTVFLEGIHFPIEIKIKKKIFNKKISYSGSIFYEGVTLRGVTFEKGVNFKHCKFEKNVNLTIVKFLGFAEFGNCVFKGSTIFQNVDFNGATFHNAVFEGKGEFNRCDFREYISFRNIKTPKESSLISFYYNGFTEDRNTEFEYNDMSKISFLRSDLRFVKFDEVKWYCPRWPATKRNCLINEFINYSHDKSWKQNLEIVKEQYQLLKMNYEENRNFAAAGDFHYGEMECQRKSLGLFRFLPTLTTAYWASSGYGERIKRAVFILCILLVLWVFSHMFLGLTPNSATNGYEPINYEFRFNNKEFNHFVKDFVKTFTYILEVLVQEEKPNRIYSPIIQKNAWINGDLINNLGFIMVYLQVLLLALAVRRRFRR